MKKQLVDRLSKFLKELEKEKCTHFESHLLGWNVSLRKEERKTL